MGILNAASGNSVWKGYDYYTEGRVLYCEQIGETMFAGRVQGKNVYSVAIDFLHIRKSSCDCAHAKSGRIICKHMVAMYFTAFPEEAKRLTQFNERWEDEQEKYEERMAVAVEDYIRKMPAAKVRKELYGLLMDSPRSAFEKFISEHSIEDSYETAVGYIGEKEFADLVKEVQCSIESSNEEITFYYNKKSKKIILDSPYSDENIDTDNDDYLKIPDKKDLKEYAVMREFALKQPKQTCELLQKALGGRGAYRKFKDAVLKLGIEKFWYAYRDENINLFARHWCEMNIV